MTDEAATLAEVRRLRATEPGIGKVRLGKALGIHESAAGRLLKKLELEDARRLGPLTTGSAASLYETACLALAEAVRVDEIKSVLDVSAAIRAYGKQAENYDIEANGVALRERAERKLGEKLIEAKSAGQLSEGRPKQNCPPAGQFPRVTLEEVGISRNLSSRAQKKAGIAQKAFDAMVERMRTDITSGRRAPDILKNGPINGARSIMGSRQEPDDSLDFFPTPPWATRALMEVVLPPLGCNGDWRIWEPACGEGHMSEVLREYSDHVCATDIFNYGPHQAEVVDFLEGGAPETDEQRGLLADWIITNPPFGDHAIKFVLRALDLAGEGVAMFFRSQWAVEGIERYEAIFRDRPPTLCAYFVERVNLCKGRWDPDGSTATAYCWLVWVKDRPPLPPFWIPPGQRERLSKPDDRARFAAWSIKESIDPNTGEISEAAE